MVLLKITNNVINNEIRKRDGTITHNICEARSEILRYYDKDNNNDLEFSNHMVDVIYNSDFSMCELKNIVNEFNSTSGNEGLLMN